MGLDKLKYLWVDIIDEWEHNIKWILFVRKYGIAYFRFASLSWVTVSSRIGGSN